MVIDRIVYQTDTDGYDTAVCILRGFNEQQATDYCLRLLKEEVESYNEWAVDQQGSGMQYEAVDLSGKNLVINTQGVSLIRNEGCSRSFHWEHGGLEIVEWKEE